MRRTTPRTHRRAIFGERKPTVGTLTVAVRCHDFRHDLVCRFPDRLDSTDSLGCLDRLVIVVGFTSGAGKVDSLGNEQFILNWDRNCWNV